MIPSMENGGNLTFLLSGSQCLAVKSLTSLATSAILRWADRPGSLPDRLVPWPQMHGTKLERAHHVYEAVRAASPLCPDLVVVHGGLVPTLLLRQVLRCPLIDYCEYYFAPRGRDLTYRIDLPAVQKLLTSVSDDGRVLVFDSEDARLHQLKQG